MSRTLIKICGITSIEDAVACALLGADMIGFVFAESPRRVDVNTARHIERVLGGDLKRVGVFTDESEDVVRVMHECSLNYVQMHGGQSEEFAGRIGPERVIRALRVRDEDSLQEMRDRTNARYFLLDTFKDGVAGGTGEVFDWSLALAAGDIGKPFFLSGGLNPSNVFEAVTRVRPFAVDVSSGVEQSPGIKNHEKIKEFIANVRAADAS